MRSDSKIAEVCKSCRSRQELSDEYVLFSFKKWLRYSRERASQSLPTNSQQLGKNDKNRTNVGCDRRGQEEATSQWDEVLAADQPWCDLACVRNVRREIRRRAKSWAYPWLQRRRALNAVDPKRRHEWRACERRVFSGLQRFEVLARPAHCP